MLTIALLQMTSHRRDQAANLAKGEAFCRQARELGADIALFPEMWNVGYATCPRDEVGRREWSDSAVNAEDEFVLHFVRLARELGMAIALTYLERWPGGPRNSMSLIDRQGRIVFTYAKVHTCDFAMEAACTPGDQFEVGTLGTAAGEVRVGAMICYDREFPESARVLMLKGAEIILTPNACHLDPPRLGQFRARAFENMVGLAMANYAAPEHNGHSMAVDAVTYDSENGAALEPLLVEAGEKEEIVLARFDLERLRAYRARESWGNAFRKPRAYASLVSDDVQPPFQRSNPRRQRL